jgi:hypothetical protein
MMDSFRSTTVPVQWSAPLPLPQPGTGIVRRYQLIVVATGAAGRQRPLLGLRWHLPIYEQKQQQANMIRPFVLRTALGECIETHVTNMLSHTPLCLALVDDDYGILDPGGTVEIAPGESLTCIWRCRHAGIYPIYNRASHDPVERRNLLGVLIIEP